MNEPLKPSACETADGRPMRDPNGDAHRPHNPGPAGNPAGNPATPPRQRWGGDRPPNRGPLLNVTLFLLALAAGLGALALLLRFGILWLLLLLFAGVLLAVMLRALAVGVHRRTGLSQGWSLGLVVLTLLGGLVALVWFSAPRFAEQVNQMSQEIPRSVQQVKQSLAKYPWAQKAVEQAPSVGEIADSPDLLRRITGVAGRALNGVAYALVLLFIGIYLAAAPDENLNGVVLLFPCRRRRRVREVLLEAGETLRLWMLGQLIPMLAVGAITAAGLYFLKVPMALTIGLLAAIFNFIPNFGPLFALVPAVLLAFPDGPQKALAAAAVVVGAQTLEGYLITPLVQKRMVMLPPALTIAMQVVLGLLVGGIGLALAAPATAALLVLTKMLYVEDVLGEETELPSEHHEKAKHEDEPQPQPNAP